jgi:itaconyl-CoA hydratase
MTRADDGHFLEDFAVGREFAHRGSRVVTESDRVWFAALTMNPHPLHTGASDSRGIVTVTWTVAVVVGLAVGDLTWNATANVQWSGAVFPLPVRVNDTIRAESVVDAVNHEDSTITATTTGFNQNGEKVVIITRELALRRRTDRPSTPSVVVQADGQ